MTNGWIKIYRQFVEWEWYSDTNMVRLFLHLLLIANHKDAKWRGHEIKRGQVIAGVHSLSEATGLSIQNVRTCLKRLEETGEINKQSNNRFSFITICNYNKYQAVDDGANKPNNKQVTNNQQATNHKQECKNKTNNIVEQKTLDIVREVIGHLNAMAKKKYKASGEAAQKIIMARLAEGHTIDDFKAAIDNQCRCWLGTEQEMYLRPSTLFQASKFDGYVNNTRKAPAKVHHLEQRQKDKEMAIRQEMIDMGVI